MPSQRDIFYFRIDDKTDAYCSFSNFSEDCKFNSFWQKKQSRTLITREGPHLIFERLYFAATNDVLKSRADFQYVSFDSILGGKKSSKDCAPLNLGSIHKFCSILEDELLAHKDKSIVLVANPDGMCFTNAIFLLGSYMLLQQRATMEDVTKRFQFAVNMCSLYIDDLPGNSNDGAFELYLADCWGALKRAIDQEWFSTTNENFDLAEYEHFASPLNADLHVIIPGKLIALRGPRELPGGVLFEDVVRGGELLRRNFSPRHSAEVLEQFDVKAVVRLDGPAYPRASLLGAGIAVADLAFEGAACPPPDVVAKFLLIAEGVRGAVAVHCDEGRGRTGTLAALYLMRHHGFTARQAVAWLRMVRPGSVAGGQGKYLLEREAAMRRMGGGGNPQPAAEPANVWDVMRHIEAAVAAVDHRMAALASRPAGRRNTMS